jgi:LPS export ABC transporter permease LptG/LPS export ABC transporter permease LptF
MRILDRYVIREVLPPFFLALLVFTFLLILDPVMNVAEALLAKGVPATVVGQILLTLAPQALGISIPVALLVGLLVAFGRLSGDREAVAFLACGISLWRLLRPVAVLGVAATAATLYVLVVAIPNANQAFREITFRLVAARAEGDIKPRVFFEDFPGNVLYVEDVTADGSWEGVFLADTSEPGWPVAYVAEAGHLVLDREARRVELVLEHGTRDNEADVLEFEHQSISLDPDSVFPRSGPSRTVQEMTIPQLREQILAKERLGVSPHTEIMALQQKFSIPVACLVFAVIALALGVTSRKDGKLAGFVVGIAVVFLYYVIMYTSEALTKGHWLPAEVSRWMPNIILGPVGIAALIWRSKWAGGGLPFHIGLPRWLSRPARAASAATPPTTPPARRVAVVVRVPRIDAPTPTILDRYVVRLYLRVVGLAFAGLLGLVYIAAFIDRSSYLFKGSATGMLLAQYFWYETPQFIYWVLPLAVLLGTLATIGQLARNSELTVMRACGVSLYRTAAPLIVMGLVSSAILFGLEENILAVAHRQADAIDREIRGRPPRTVSVANRNWLVGKSGEIYHYALHDPSMQSLFNLTKYEFDTERRRLVQLTAVRRATFEEGTWTATDGWTRQYRGPGTRLAAVTERFDSREIALAQPAYFETELTSADMMTFTQLRDHIQELSTSGLYVVPHLVALQRKLAFPFVTVIMTLLAVPFALTTGRRGTLYGIGVGIALALSYWLLTSLFAAIGTAGLLAPLLAAWAPNLIFGAGAIYLILTVRT